MYISIVLKVVFGLRIVPVFSCDFDADDGCAMTFTPEDESNGIFLWTLNDGGTPSADTGPSRDASSGDGTGELMLHCHKGGILLILGQSHIIHD